MAYSHSQFLALIKPAVLSDARRSHILPSLTAAQAIIESSWGNSGLTQRANNLFGIKGTFRGQYVTMATREWTGAKYVTVQAKFRAYPSWKDSITDHTNFLLRNSRYRNLIGVTDHTVACRNIQKDGYATSPTYATTLIKTIVLYGLQEWDREVLAEGEKTVKVNESGIVTAANGLRVRTSASSTAAQVIVGGYPYSMPKGQVVNIVEENSAGTWGRIGDIQGWVSMTYVDVKASL